jgi:hypothetical protein
MSSTVTTATIAVATTATQDAGLASILGLVAMLATVLVLGCLEVVGPSRRLGARRLARGGGIAAAPLLCVFFMTVALEIAR